MLQLLDVRKNYPERQVLAIRELFLESGIHWIGGENGSGKTTLLRIIGGLLPFDGDILLKQVSLKKAGVDYRRQVAWAEAEPVYPGFLKGSELFAFYCDIRKEAKTGAADLAGMFGVEKFLQQPCSTYSAGMMKRLSLLLAFTGKPALILLDEPLATLDENIAGLLPRIMTDTARRHGTSFLYSSHHPFPEPGFSGVTRWQLQNGTLNASA